MITLITMTQGNPIAFKRTLDSFKSYVNEVVWGDLILFDEDRKLIESFQNDYNAKQVRLPFNYIFKNGFAQTLNYLASFASNDHVIYMNVGEVIDIIPGNKLFTVPKLFNCYYFNHATEVHHWYRMYNRNEMEWQGLIHEEIRPLPNFEARPCKLASFRMADTEKDMNDSFKAKVYNDVKEIVYFKQYIRLVEEPHMRSITNAGWIEYSIDGYGSLKQRIKDKGDRLIAFEQGNLEMYMYDILNNPEFEKERFESSVLINYQGGRRDKL